MKVPGLSGGPKTSDSMVTEGCWTTQDSTHRKYLAPGMCVEKIPSSLGIGFFNF